MTSEIAILNKEAVALAADSAVTMISPSGEKIFTSANKLFTLSKYHSIGIMIYGNALFMGIPWETIIKIYREKLYSKSFPTVKDYAEDFINFISTENIFSEKSQQMYFKTSIYSYLNFIKESIKDEVRKELERKNEVEEKDIKRIIKKVIQEQHELWKNGDCSSIIQDPKAVHNKLLEKHGEDMDSMIKEVLEKLPILGAVKRKLKDILSFLFYKFPENIEYTERSGVVIAGFGDNEIFPSLVEYKIEGIIDGILKYKTEKIVNIELNGADAIIIPFAQKDMIQLFMEGIYRDYLDAEQYFLKDLLAQFLDIVAEKTGHNFNKDKIINEILTDFGDKFSKYMRENYTNPIMDVVSLLPKPELAMMAETLVNLTSLKRKWSADRETVGGPIDVALISKGDGFIWIKRKHYFNPELNPYFLEKYFMEVRK